MSKCVVCGEDATKLEKHHLFGKKFGEQTVWLCLNHHNAVTAAQNQLPLQIRNSESQIDKDIFALTSSLALHMEMFKHEGKVIERLIEWRLHNPK